MVHRRPARRKRIATAQEGVVLLANDSQLPNSGRVSLVADLIAKNFEFLFIQGVFGVMDDLTHLNDRFSCFQGKALKFFSEIGDLLGDNDTIRSVNNVVAHGGSPKVVNVLKVSVLDVTFNIAILSKSRIKHQPQK